jgi:uncharacterized protein YkwD
MTSLTESTSVRTRRTRRVPGVWRAVVAAVVLPFALLVLPARPASADATFNSRMLELVNRDRAANGLRALVADATLGGIAEDAPYNGCGFTVHGRAKDMGLRNYFSHTILGCPTQSVFNIINATGLVTTGAAENIAWMNGTTDPLVAAENLHNQLMNSPSHRANILNGNFSKVGIGSWRTSTGQTWSGGGTALGNVFVAAQVFAGGPVDPAPTTTTTPTTTPPSGPSGRYTPLTPARILDTRDGTGGVVGAVPSGGTIDVQIAGRGGVPSADLAGVAMTVTVTQPTQPGYLTVYPSGTARPAPSNLNFSAGETTANLVVVKVGANGKVSVFNSVGGSTHVIVDVAGWYSGAATGSAGRFEPLAPSRILDTRNGTGGGVRLGPGGSFDLQITGRGGVPASGVQAAVVNVTVAGPSADSFLTVFPTGEARPWASNVNFAPGQTVASRAQVKLGAGGKVTIYNGAGWTDVIVDVGGWYTDASVAGSLGAFVPVIPARILDTRDGTGGLPGALGTGGTVDIQITGRGGVPSSGARAVILNVTVTQPVAGGYLTIYPAGSARPLASDVNYLAGDNQPNLVVVKLGTGGKVGLYASAGTHVIYDVAGWIS